MGIPEKTPSQGNKGRRELKGIYKYYFRFVTILAVLMCILFIFKIPVFGYVMAELTYFALLVAAFVSSVFLRFPAAKSSPRDRIPFYDVLLAGLTLPGMLFVATHPLDILLKGWEVNPPPVAFVLGLLTWALIIEAVRRTGGLVLASVILVISIYPLFAYLMPGIFMAREFSLERIVGFHYLGTESILGMPTAVSAKLVIGYMFMAVVLVSTGAGDFFFKLCMALLGHVRGGAAKVSILTSAFFATMSGSPVANVVTTGAVTIPAMRRTGYPDYYAAAIEATASKGGALSPPVMGITAFIMADFIGVSYTQVCISASLPILLYWISLFVQADFYAAKSGLRGLPREELPTLWEAFKEGWYYLVSLGILIFYIFEEYLVAQAPFYAVVAVLIMTNFRRENRLSPRKLLNLIDGTGNILTELMAILAGVGMVIGSLSLTGTAHGLTGVLTRLGGQNLLLLLLVGAMTSFILGIGLTISACYIFLAMLLAPTLVNLGLDEMAAHLFLIYWGSVSYITPPVALAAYAAASMAGANPLKTSFQAVKLGFVSLLIPFAFVLNPALVAHGSLQEILQTIALAIAGILLIGSGFEGYTFYLKRLSGPQRGLFMAGGVLLLGPYNLGRLIGVALFLVGLTIHFSWGRAASATGKLPDR